MSALLPLYNNTLSRDESALLDRAVSEEQGRQRRDSAVEVIAQACDEYELDYERITEHKRAGELAAKLLATWEPSQQPEAWMESDYATVGLMSDLRAALNAHGLDTYEERCQEIGKRLVDSARAYIFSVHGMSDAEDGEQLAAQRRREYRRELASADRED